MTRHTNARERRRRCTNHFSTCGRCSLQLEDCDGSHRKSWKQLGQGATNGAVGGERLAQRVLANLRQFEWSKPPPGAGARPAVSWVELVPNAEACSETELTYRPEGVVIRKNGYVFPENDRLLPNPGSYAERARVFRQVAKRLAKALDGPVYLAEEGTVSPVAHATWRAAAARRPAAAAEVPGRRANGGRAPGSGEAGDGPECSEASRGSHPDGTRSRACRCTRPRVGGLLRAREWRSRPRRPRRRRRRTSRWRRPRATRRRRRATAAIGGGSRRGSGIDGVPAAQHRRQGSCNAEGDATQKARAHAAPVGALQPE